MRTPRPIQIILIAALIVLVIASFSALLDADLSALQGRLEAAPVETIQAPESGVKIMESNVDKLGFGTEQPVFEFSIAAAQDLTLRYVALELESSGLDLSQALEPDTWALYEKKNGKVDYREKIGEGNEVRLEDGHLWVRLKLEGELAAAGYHVEQIARYVVTSTVKRYEDYNPEITGRVSLDRWGMAYGFHEESWAFVGTEFMVPREEIMVERAT